MNLVIILPSYRTMDDIALRIAKIAIDSGYSCSITTAAIVFRPEERHASSVEPPASAACASASAACPPASAATSPITTLSIPCRCPSVTALLNCTIDQIITERKKCAKCTAEYANMKAIYDAHAAEDGVTDEW